MARLIDADKLRDVLANRVPYAIVTTDDAAFAYGLDAAYAAVMEAPTVDAEPVRRGRWIPNEYGVGWWCGECKQHVRRKRKYCPECGARMDGEGGGEG